MKCLLFLVVFSASFLSAFPQAGHLDSSFKTNGIQRTVFLKGNVLHESAKKVLRQPDGKLLVVFSSSLDQGMIVRYLADGTLDMSYGKSGFSQTIPLNPKTAVMQSNGKVVVVGNSFNNTDGDFATARVLTNGNLDSTFGINGRRITNFGLYEYGNAVAIQSDGKVVVAGTSGEDMAIARYHSNGAPDNTFSGDGKQVLHFSGTEEGYGVAIQSDGKIVVAGRTAGGEWPNFQSNFAVARLTTTGVPDNTFSGDGKQVTDFGFEDYVNALTIQSDGKIVLAGMALTGSATGSPGDFAVARYLSNGTPDNTFSGDGKQTTHIANHDAAFSIAQQTDGKLIVAGLATSTNQNFAIVRYSTNGNIDLTFSDDGKQQSNFGSDDIAFSALIQPDGKIVVAGQAYNGSEYDYAMSRYNANGTVDLSFSADGLVKGFFAYDAPTGYAASAVQADGKLVVAGYVEHKISGSAGNRDFAVARYLANGSLDNTFNQSGKVTTNFGATDAAAAVAVLPDGKIVVAGSSGNLIAIARYNANGTLDNTFDADGKVLRSWGASGFVSSMAIQADGKIIIGGSVVTTPNITKFAVARFNANGSIDYTFSGDGKTTTDLGGSDRINALALQKDGKIVAVGSSVNESTSEMYFGVARYNTNGTPDNTFSGDGKQVKNFLLGWMNEAKAVAIQGDGKILVAGDYRDQLTTSMLLARYKTDGSLDATFSGDGLLAIDFGGSAEASAVVIQPDGKSVVGGSSNGQSRFALARCKTDGTLDVTFGISGKRVTSLAPDQGSINALKISQQRLYAVGGADFYFPSKGLVAAYQLGSMMISSFQQLESVAMATVLPNPSSTHFSIQTTGMDGGMVRVRVTDMLGRMVEQRSVNANSRIQLGHQYRPGVYHVELIRGKERSVIRVVKQ